jgi:hypothetical protein
MEYVYLKNNAKMTSTLVQMIINVKVVFTLAKLVQNQNTIVVSNVRNIEEMKNINLKTGFVNVRTITMKILTETVYLCDNRQLLLKD